MMKKNMIIKNKKCKKNKKSKKKLDKTRRRKWTNNIENIKRNLKHQKW